MAKYFCVSSYTHTCILIMHIYIWLSTIHIYTKYIYMANYFLDTQNTCIWVSASVYLCTHIPAYWLCIYVNSLVLYIYTQNIDIWLSTFWIHKIHIYGSLLLCIFVHIYLHIGYAYMYIA